MEGITYFIHSQRTQALPVGGYAHYQKICSQKLLQLRRKLKIVTPRGRRYERKRVQDITLEDYSKDAQWKDYLIFSAERAWANAMRMKSMHAGDTGEAALTGTTKTHIVSRLVKARKVAAHLVTLVKQGTGEAKPPELAVQEGAYLRMLESAAAFESQKWELCLAACSEAYVVYTALDANTKSNFFEEWTSDNIEPSIRYAAYQLRLPRTLSLAKIVARYVRKESEFVQQALQLCPSAIAGDKAEVAENASATSVKDLQGTISWRGRTVLLEDARIAQALAAVKQAENKLAESLSSSAEATAKVKAAAYEDILTPSQDAVDVTKTAIDELASEGVASSDARMQSLQITRTAVNYDLIGWRIGRNRVLCGEDDGLSFEPEAPRLRRAHWGKRDEDKAPVPTKPREEGTGRKLARLRERLVLYDSTLQSLDSVRELPGVAADQQLTNKLTSRKAYFSALRSLAIARSHVVLGNNRNALALFARALQYASSISVVDDDEPTANSSMPRQLLTSVQAKSLNDMLQSLTLRYRALVELDIIESEAIKAEKAKAAWALPLIERMDEYPPGGADLTNLVNYPPKLRPVPVKPIFLDVAWNYIQYPGQAKEKVGAVTAQAQVEEEKPVKKGWFGFGRS